MDLRGVPLFLMSSILAAVAAAAGTPAVTANAVPAAPYVEIRDVKQHLNFDVILHNTGMVPLRLVAIREKILGPGDDVWQEREVNSNGKPSALSGFGELILLPGGYKDVFQPFQDYESAGESATVRLTFIFLNVDRPVPPIAVGGDAVVSVDVTPREYHPVPYCLPLNGHLLVHDGHDLYSHHRRRDLVAVTAGDPLRGRNANLYAYDLVRVDDDGALFHGTPDRKEDWLTFGAPVTAPVAGVVAEAVDGVPDNTFVDGEAVVPPEAEALDPLGLGNHVLIRAADGRVSWLLHMEPGSIAVKTGDRVVPGQMLGRVGLSGDSIFPHLHFNVTDGVTYPSQGVPSYFRQFRRQSGKARKTVAYGQIDSGDIISADPSPECHP
jgi:Peptidase family M23